MVGFLPQGNDLQSGAQTLTNRIISNPFVNQWANSPGGGGGSAYTVDVLNALQPLGVSNNQYPHLAAPGAPAPQNGGAGGLANNPLAMNQIQQQLYQYQGGPRGDRGTTGNIMYDPALHDPNSWLYKAFSSQGLDPNRMFHPMYANGNPILPGSNLSNSLNAYQMDYNAAHGGGGPRGDQGNNLNVPFQQPQPYQPRNPMMQPMMPQMPQNQNPGFRQPSAPSPQPSHSMNIFSHLGGGGGGNR